jgi:hypothetical protein
MGIVYQDFSPKPAYLAYATLTRVLQGKRFIGPVEAPSGVLAYRFKPAAGEVGETIAIWSPLQDATVELAAAAQQVSGINGMGEQMGLQVEGGKVRLKLRKGAPVYLVYR